MKEDEAARICRWKKTRYCVTSARCVLVIITSDVIRKNVPYPNSSIINDSNACLLLCNRGTRLNIGQPSKEPPQGLLNPRNSIHTTFCLRFYSEYFTRGSFLCILWNRERIAFGQILVRLYWSDWYTYVSDFRILLTIHIDSFNISKPASC